MSKVRCCARLRGFAPGTCERPATVERDGRPFCWQHDPVRLEEDRKAGYAANMERLRREEAEREARFVRQDLLRDSGIRDASDDDLRKLVALGGLSAVLAKLEGGQS